MITFYIIIVGMLLLLAVFDLYVGVSNDAVNFMNSAVGSKALRFKTLMVLSAVGVFAGASLSNGMMDVARHGIFRPDFYSFSEIAIILVSVMLTDVILLDRFNSAGMPTSTTVSMVFELLGGTVALATLKTINNSSSVSFGDLLNTEKALAVILAIFVSVAIAFTIGVVVQYITRFILTFGYKKRLGWFIGLFGGVSFTSITYFILVKGLKTSALPIPESLQFVKEGGIEVVLGMFAIFFVVSHVLHWLGGNVLKVIIGFGTFSLAFAFAGNDLVNFVGVPLTGLSALQHLLADGGNPETYMMAALSKSEPGQWYLLVMAGGVMVTALLFSKKAKNVVKTSVALSSQGTSEEIFGTNPVARALVRLARGAGKWVGTKIPQGIDNALQKSFDTRKIQLEDRDAAFDLVRAGVNLTLASSLIALGTSLKLPLSTTYVTFMVAMGTSLADKAWSRETAVYRVTGVLSVIGGWFATAFIAFACCFLVALVIYFGGFPVIFILFAVVLFVLIKSNFVDKETKRNQSAERFNQILNAPPETNVFPLVQDHCRLEWSEILDWEKESYRQIIYGFLREDLGELRTVNKQVKILKRHLEIVRRQGTLCSEKMARENRVLKNFFLYQVNDFMGETVSSLEQIVVPCKQHVDNGFSPMDNGKRKVLLRMVNDVSDCFDAVSLMIRDADFSNYDSVRENVFAKSESLRNIRKDEMMQSGSICAEGNNIRIEMLYLTLLYESRSLLDTLASVCKSGQKFLYNKNKGIDR